MTRNTLLVAVVCSWVVPLTTIAQTSPMNDINQKIEVLLAAKLNKIDAPGLREEALTSSQDFIDLQSLCRANWNSVMDDLNSVSGGNDGKEMLFLAFEATLGAPDYMSALEKVGSLFAQGQLSKPLMLVALRPRSRMQAFLADNYQHPRVTALLSSLKLRLLDDSDATEDINDILSGQTKTGLDDFRAAHQDTSEGNIPKIILPP